jgi:hypothetical protein
VTAVLLGSLTGFRSPLPEKLANGRRWPIRITDGSGPGDPAGRRERRMAATIIGSEGGMLWLVAVLLVLAGGLAGALLAATRVSRDRPVSTVRTGTARADRHRLS